MIDPNLRHTGPVFGWICDPRDGSVYVLEGECQRWWTRVARRYEQLTGEQLCIARGMAPDGTLYAAEVISRSAR